MSKKLKIQFWKAEKALAMQVLEQEGLPKKKKEGNILILGIPEFRDDNVFLRGDESIYNWEVARTRFDSNSERDAYLEKIVNAITDELFTDEGELKVGEMCEVRHTEYNNWDERKLIAVLPDQYNNRFIVESIYDSTLYLCLNHARPIAKRTEPIVEECGQVVTYTWEEK